MHYILKELERRLSGKRIPKMMSFTSSTETRFELPSLYFKGAWEKAFRQIKVKLEEIAKLRIGS